MITAASRPRVLDVIFYGGLAAGLLGKDVFAGGAGTAALGLFLHFFIACAGGSCCESRSSPAQRTGSVRISR